MRLAVAATIAVVVGFCAIDAAFVVQERPSTVALCTAMACFAGILATQLIHSFPRLVPLPPRARYATLGLQAVLSFVPYFFFGQAFIGMPPLLAASMLLVLPPVTAWPLFTAVTAGNVAVVFLLGDGYDIAWLGVEMLMNTLIVFGLSKLTDLVAEVHRSRTELTRLAVTTERLRFARDLHDLLGYSLSTITLKCELANRLVPRDTTRAQHELTEILHTSRQALADVRTVARGYRQMNLADEAETARTTLAATQIHTTLRIDSRPLPPDVDTVLATVLREGLTNMLRHSKAEHCAITTTHTKNTIRLHLTNDGAAGQPDRGPADSDSGSGLGNLTTRVARLGGTLTARHADDWFHLTAELPLRPERPGGDSERGQRRPRPVQQPATLAPRTATTLVVAALCAYLFQGATYMYQSKFPAEKLTWAVVTLTAGVLLQARQSFPRVPSSRPLRHPLATLTAQIALSFVPYAVFGTYWWGLPGLVAGTALLILPRATAWTVFGTADLLNLAILWHLGLHNFVTLLYIGCMAPMTGLVVFGLSRLKDLVVEVHRSRAELTRLAVTTERLRFARDLHDLLGYSLSTITLKCELANRLVPRDTTRAQQELAEILHTSRQALADVRTVARGYRQMSLADEAKAAHSMLTATGIRTTVDVTDTTLPTDTDTVLATVLREGLTNVLRHSKAEHCAISTAHAEGAIVLRLANDGASTATTAPSLTDQGSGIGNLTTRVSRLGGSLTAHHEDDWFHLTARIPLPVPATAGA
ncbi:histidine kinase [Streptantibioticus parmotrematis]|uniref:sensor histidine kinase n=1 Tax=Streptantibioticus parmotrematis TaxID=2873249 RepID=UPI0033E32C4A